MQVRDLFRGLFLERANRRNPRRITRDPPERAGRPSDHDGFAADQGSSVAFRSNGRVPLTRAGGAGSSTFGRTRRRQQLTDIASSSESCHLADALLRLVGHHHCTVLPPRCRSADTSPTTELIQ